MAEDVKKTDALRPRSETPDFGMDAKRPVPTFPQEQVRHREAYLTLIKELSVILGNNWDGEEIRPDDIKRRISAAIANSLRIWI